MNISNEDIQAVLLEEDSTKLRQIIRRHRLKEIKTNEYYINMAAEEARFEDLIKKGNYDKAISNIREIAYNRYLKDEEALNASVLADAAEKIPVIYKNANRLLKDLGPSQESIKEAMIKFPTMIMPALYVLSQSNTQSRRSRAGKEFEMIIERILILKGYKYEVQARRAHEQIDFCLPSVDKVNRDPHGSASLSLKTTIRERYRQVLDEAESMKGVFNCLLTLDNNITQKTVESVREKGVYLVVPEDQKEKFESEAMVVTYKTLFDDELEKLKLRNEK